jgi:hypothetical protein
MSSSNRIERDRGIKEFHGQLAVLRDKWPLAFPLNDQDVRPLAIGSTRDIAAAMSWSLRAFYLEDGASLLRGRPSP